MLRAKSDPVSFLFHGCGTRMSMPLHYGIACRPWRSVMYLTEGTGMASQENRQRWRWQRRSRSQWGPERDAQSDQWHADVYGVTDCLSSAKVCWPIRLCRGSEVTAQDVGRRGIGVSLVLSLSPCWLFGQPSLGNRLPDPQRIETRVEYEFTLVILY